MAVFKISFTVLFAILAFSRVNGQLRPIKLLRSDNENDTIKPELNESEDDLKLLRFDKEKELKIASLDAQIHKILLKRHNGFNITEAKELTDLILNKLFSQVNIDQSIKTLIHEAIQLLSIVCKHTQLVAAKKDSDEELKTKFNKRHYGGEGSNSDEGVKPISDEQILNIDYDEDILYSHSAMDNMNILIRGRRGLLSKLARPIKRLVLAIRSRILMLMSDIASLLRK